MDDILMENYSPTYEALSIIYEAKESESIVFKSFVTANYLMESGASNDIVMEGVSDIFHSIVEAIKKFITKIKEFFKKILFYITSAYQDLNKVAKEVDKIIKDKNKTIKFTISGYEFTVIDSKGPDITEFQNLVSEYNSDMEKLSELKEAEVKDAAMEWLQETHLDKLRADVLGAKAGGISKDDFITEVRKSFRNDEEETHDIEVDDSYVNDIINHAKKLEDTKKDSIKDRDKLIKLLSETEKFFDRTIQTYYKGNQKYVNASKVNVDDDKFSKESNEVRVDDKLSKIISKYASYKYQQVNAISTMINTVATERVNALRDQIKQERTILRKCIFGGEDATKKDDVSESFGVGIDGKDYSIVAMESDIASYNDYERLQRHILIEETEFILKSIEDGEIYRVLEADTEKLSGKIKQTVADIIEMVIKKFRQKAMGNAEFNKAWVEDIMSEDNKLIDKAKAKKEFTMTSFSTANYSKMLKDLSSTITQAYNNKDYESVSWATSIVPSVTTPEIMRDTDTRTNILNYYRTGTEGSEIKTIKYDGNSLAKEVPNMVEYIKNYAGSVTEPVDGLNNTFKTASTSFKVTESWSPDTYIGLLGCSICESDVVLCRDYDSVFGVMEAGDVKIGQANEGLKDGATKSTNQSAKSAGKEGEAPKSASAVSSVDDEEKKKEVEQATDDNKANSNAVAYKKMIDTFFKNCITLYLKAREEQYIAYINALSDIDGEKPKKDKNGNYIPKAEREKEEKAKAEEAVKTESK